MKSIKPGRGPSVMSGVMCVVVGIFGVLWTIGAASIGVGLFSLFGVLFIVIAISFMAFSPTGTYWTESEHLNLRRKTR